MPTKYYPNKFYPSFISGPAYVMTGDSANKLINTIDKYRCNVLVLEDVFITGIVSEISRVHRYNSNKFKLSKGCNNICALLDSIAIFMCNDINQMKWFWQNWIKSSPKKCPKRKLG